MTDNGKAIQLKLQKVKANAAGHAPTTHKVFLGNFVYAEFMKKQVRLTDEDGCGRVIDTIMLDSEQMNKFLTACVGEYC
jgi:hypothetical protein